MSNNSGSRVDAYHYGDSDHASLPDAIAAKRAEIDAIVPPTRYRDSLALAALVWHEAQNDMTRDRAEAHRMLMREASAYIKREGLDG